MDIKALQHQLSRHNRWKTRLDEQLCAYGRWLREHGLANDNALSPLRQARKLLEGEHFTIACVGEFSRGKTELLNALLFSDSGRRILPSQPGRTTMCPTEICADPEVPNGLRLLPIETRRTRASLESFRRIPQKWITLRFDPDNPQQLQQAMSQVSAQKWVSVQDAEALGFSLEQLGATNHEGRVQVPTWRHALISLDHPLLRQGLRIVDTPGLNALGNEPELTLKTLPEAQAILFLLAADSGVSASDMAIWRDHIQSLRENRCTAVIALLNKIDTLWDDLQPESEVKAAIERIRTQTAQQLGLPEDQVLTVSAKQALIARVQGRTDLLRRSHFPQLEAQLSECIARRQTQLASHPLLKTISDTMHTTQEQLQVRLNSCAAELQFLRNDGGDLNIERLRELRESIRQQHHRYHKQALSLRTSQRLLDNQRQTLLDPIGNARLEQQITRVQQKLVGSWTTVGLSRAMAHFFEGIDNDLQHLEREVERANRVLQAIYLRSDQPKAKQFFLQQKLDINRPRQQLRRLQGRAEQFRSSLNTLLTAKQTLINRFIATLVQEVRHQYLLLNEQVGQWLSDALMPLVQGNQYQKQLLEHHMLRLTRLQGAQDNQREQLSALQENLHTLEAALTELEPLCKHFNEPMAEPLTQSAKVLSLADAREAHGS
ncbi:dynamin family protein [Marinimicrobium alkaliphilum]|uniref:dynamin family protein n=1 Tax=Marinimicrobium alkaliphilum TaxID=2202654 RepID=UPI000DBA8F68|nr:dynamin family protein [Marinimicrobium alkaliphilum]